MSKKEQLQEKGKLPQLPEYYTTFSKKPPLSPSKNMTFESGKHADQAPYIYASHCIGFWGEYLRVPEEEHKYIATMLGDQKSSG